MSSELMTIKDCMNHFGVSRTTIWRRINSGELKSFMFGGKRFVKREWVDEIDKVKK